MDNKNVGLEGGLPEGIGGLSTARTYEQIYATIMSDKRKAQEIPVAKVVEPVVHFRSGGVGASLRSNMLEQVLLDGLPAGQEDAPLSMMRSNTMEHILRETLSGGRELQDLLLEWDHSLPEEKLVEGLASDMQAIDAAPPDVAIMRRTFTIERILSGAESDLAGLLRANQLQQHMVRQLSGAAAVAAAAVMAAAGGGGGGSDGHGGCVDSAKPVGSSGRLFERLQRQESIHRLAASSGPNQQPRSHSSASGGGGACAKGPSTLHSLSHSQSNSHSRGGGGGSSAPGLLRASHGSGRFGTAGAAADDESAQPRSPKRHKALHHVKPEVGMGPVMMSPERTGSQSLLDLAKVAAALDGDLESGGGEVEHGAAGEKRVLWAECAGSASEKQLEQGQGQLQRQQTQMDAGRALVGGGGGGGGRPEGRLVAAATATATIDEAAATAAATLATPAAVSVLQLGSAAVTKAEAVAAGQMGSRAGGGGRGGSGGGGGAVVEAAPQDSRLLMSLQSEASRLQWENAMLNEQLELVMVQVELVQQRNAAMKTLLLEACHAKGIPADMELLNVSLQHHRSPPLSDDIATHVAASVLGINGGDVLASIQHLIGSALMRITGSSGVGAPKGLQTGEQGR